MKPDYPHPTVWPPPSTPPHQRPPTPAKPAFVPLWQKVFGLVSLFCSAIGMTGTFFINPSYSSDGRLSPQVKAHYDRLATLWDISQLLVLLGLIFGIFGWRSLCGKIGLGFFALTFLGILTLSLLSYWRVYGHF